MKVNQRRRSKSFPNLQHLKNSLQTGDQDDLRHVPSKKPLGKRHSWPMSRKSRTYVHLASLPDNCEKFSLVKGYFLTRKQNGHIRLSAIENRLSPIIRAIPVVIVVTALVLQVADVTTDGLLTEKICNADNCNCIVGVDYDGALDCLHPQDLCGAALIGGNYAWDYCSSAGVDTACINKDPWPLPQTCRCAWENQRCSAAGETCGSMLKGNTTGRVYCKQHKDPVGCLTPTWNVSNDYKSQKRFPAECRFSATFIIGPSLINNMILLISLVHKDNYKKILKTAGVPTLGEMHFTKFAIGLLGLIQVLPFVCLMVKIVIIFRVFLKKIDETTESQIVQTLTVRMNIIYSMLEDLPQFYFQSKFFLQAVHGNSYGIVDWRSSLIIVGLLTSCLSLCKNYTQYTIGPKDGKLQQF